MVPRRDASSTAAAILDSFHIQALLPCRTRQFVFMVRLRILNTTLLLLWCLLWCPPVRAGLEECLSKAGEVAMPGSDSFNRLRLVNNAWFNSETAFPWQPSAIVLPANASGVQLAVKCAKEHGLRVTPRCGGHGQAGGQCGSPGRCTALPTTRRPPHTPEAVQVTSAPHHLFIHYCRTGGAAWRGFY